MFIVVVLWGLKLGKKGNLVLTYTIALISAEGYVPFFSFQFRQHFWITYKCQGLPLASMPRVHCAAADSRPADFCFWNGHRALQLSKAGFPPPLQVPVDCWCWERLLYIPMLVSGPFSLAHVTFSYVQMRNLILLSRRIHYKGKYYKPLVKLRLNKWPSVTGFRAPK